MRNKLVEENMKRKRVNMLIGKKQLLLMSLTCVLALAIYVNYLMGQSPNGAISSTEEKEVYGDTQLVSADIKPQSSESSDEYFAKARLERTNSRDETIETLKTFMNGGDVTAEELEVMAKEALEYTALSEKETEIENIIKSQGYEDCMVYLDGTNANILVKTSGLDAVGAAQIKSVLLDKVAVEAENITIIEVK